MLLWTPVGFWGSFWFWIIMIPIVVLWIAVLIDVVAHPRLSGWAKVGWVILILILPILGSLIYLIARPTFDRNA